MIKIFFALVISLSVIDFALAETFEVKSKRVISKFIPSQECKNLHNSWLKCKPAKCVADRIIDGEMTKSDFEIFGNEGGKCHAVIHHVPKGSKKSPPTFNCFFNNLQLRELSRTHKLIMSGEAVTAEYTSCLSEKSKGPLVKVGPCEFRIGKEKFLDIQKMAIYFKQCKVLKKK